MIKMSYFNKRMTSLGVATALALTMSSCSVSEKKISDSLNGSSIGSIMDNNSDNKINGYEENDLTESKVEKETTTSQAAKPSFDPNAPIAVPIEIVTMENGDIGYKMPQLYEPYLVDENRPYPMVYKTLESTDDYKILSAGVIFTYDYENSELTEIYCGFEGSVAMYHPYWRVCCLDKERCDNELLELIYKAESEAEQVYLDQTKVITKK